jgi:hypothetical protein
MSCRLRFFARVANIGLILALTGCATLTGSSTQTIEVTTVDARDRPVRGMTCTLTHGSGNYVFDTPVTDFEIKRSSTDLEIECRRGSQVARGTVIPRAESAIAHAFIPGGSIATLVDFATGAMYTYPSPLRLRIGQHLRFDTGGEARATVVANVGDPAPATPAAAAKASTTSAPATKPAPTTTSTFATRSASAPRRTDSSGSAATP